MTDIETTYRGYTIHYDPPPIPFRGCDWHFTHQDYDGGYYDAEGSVCEGDPRHGSAASAQACRDEIDAMEDEE